MHAHSISRCCMRAEAGIALEFVGMYYTYGCARSLISVIPLSSK
jgi:hypothetical protein